MATKDDVKRMKAAKDVDGLTMALGDEVWIVRRAAAWVLGKLGDARAVQPLIKALGDDNRRVRRAAAEALGKLGDAQAVQPLSKALGDEDEDVRRNAARALGKLGDPWAVPPLIKILGDEYEDVRKAAAEALGKFGEPAIPFLIRALKKGQSSAANALEKMPHAAVGTEFERLELYDDANEWYTSHGMFEKAAAVRRKMAEMGAAKVSQKVVHGDEVTTIQDSVVSKSTIGPGGGGDDLLAKLQQLSEMHKDGILSDEQFEAAKNKLLG